MPVPRKVRLATGLGRPAMPAALASAYAAAASSVFMNVPRSYRLPFSLMRAWYLPERVLLTPCGKPERGLGLTGPP